MAGVSCYIGGHTHRTHSTWQKYPIFFETISGLVYTKKILNVITKHYMLMKKYLIGLPTIASHTVCQTLSLRLDRFLASMFSRATRASLQVTIPSPTSSDR